MDVGGGMNIFMRCRGNCGGTAEQHRPIRGLPFAHWRNAAAPARCRSLRAGGCVINSVVKNLVVDPTSGDGG